MTIIFLIVCNRKKNYFNRFETFKWNFEERRSADPQRAPLFAEEQPEGTQSSQTDLQTDRLCASTTIGAFAIMLHCFEISLDVQYS